MVGAGGCLPQLSPRGSRCGSRGLLESRFDQKGAPCARQEDIASIGCLEPITRILPARAGGQDDDCTTIQSASESTSLVSHGPPSPSSESQTASTCERQVLLNPDPRTTRRGTSCLMAAGMPSPIVGAGPPADAWLLVLVGSSNQIEGLSKTRTPVEDIEGLQTYV